MNIRGYTIKNVNNIGNKWRKIEVNICGIETFESVQLRWLETAVFYPSIVRDVWVLDDVVMAIVSPNNNITTLLCDDFEHENLR